MNDKLPVVVSEGEVNIAPGLTLRVLTLDNGQRVIPSEDMQRACEWLGVDLSALGGEVAFEGG